MASFVITLDAEDSALDRKVANAERKLNRIDQKAGNLGGYSRYDAPAGGGGFASSGSRGGLGNPWERADRAHENLSFAQDWGFRGGQLKTLELEAARADAAMKRADRVIAGTTMQGRAMDALMTSRVGANGLMPLVNRLAGILGPEAMMVAGGGFLAAKAYGAGLDSIHDLGSAYWTGGGSVGETASVSAVGRFLGRSASESAGAAVGFGDSLHNATFGAGYMRSRGIVDFGGMTTDKDKNYLLGVRALMDEPDRGMATRVAREVGLTDELWMRDLSRGQREELFAGMSDDASAAGRHDEATYRYDKAKISSVWDKITRGFAHGASSWLTPGGFIANAVTFGMYGNEQAVEGFMGWGSDASDDTAGSTSGSVPRRFNVATHPGVRGGGPRVNASLPSQVRAQQFSENSEAYGQYMGGYLS